MNGIFGSGEGSGYIYALNPSVKLILAFGAGMSAFAVRSITGALFIAFMTIVAAATSSMGRRAVAAAWLIIRISILFFIIEILCMCGGEVLFTVGPLKVTDEGLHFSIMMVSKLIAASLPLVLVISSTMRGDLANSLVQNCHLSYRWAFALSASLKFIPALADEMEQVMEAQRSRGVDFDVRNPVKKVSLIIPLCMPLLLSCVRKIETSAVSAQLRGFELRRNDSGYKKYPIGMREALAAIVCIAVFVGAFFL